MNPPHLSDLPSPESSRTGWPWTEESSPVPNAMPNGSSWPNVTLVTAVYNQRDYLEETIRSVLLQGYPNLEYILIDDGSTDHSDHIYRRYEQWLHWERKANGGASSAYNQGFKQARGDVVGWINSDDYFLPRGLELALTPYQDDRVEWTVGEAVYVDEKGERTGVQPFRFSDDPGSWFFINSEFLLPQQGSFWKRSVFEQIGYMDEHVSNCFDYELFFRMLEHGYRPVFTNAQAAAYRFHDTSKSVSQKHRFYSENVKVWEMYRHLCPEKDLPRLEQLIRQEVLDIEVTRCEQSVGAGRRSQGLANLWRTVATRRWLFGRRLFWSTTVKALLGRQF